MSAREAGVPTNRPDMELALSAKEVPFVIKHVLIMKRAKRNFPLTSVVQFRTKFVEEFARENARARSERTERAIRGQEGHLVCLAGLAVPIDPRRLEKPSIHLPAERKEQPNDENAGDPAEVIDPSSREVGASEGLPPTKQHVRAGSDAKDPDGRPCELCKPIERISPRGDPHGAGPVARKERRDIASSPHYPRVRVQRGRTALTGRSRAFAQMNLARALGRVKSTIRSDTKAFESNALAVAPRGHSAFPMSPQDTDLARKGQHDMCSFLGSNAPICVSHVGAPTEPARTEGCCGC